jgi:hypothetical protein
LWGALHFFRILGAILGSIYEKKTSLEGREWEGVIIWDGKGGSFGKMRSELIVTIPSSSFLTSWRSERPKLLSPLLNYWKQDECKSD